MRWFALAWVCFTGACQSSRQAGPGPQPDAAEPAGGKDGMAGGTSSDMGADRDPDGGAGSVGTAEAGAADAAAPELGATDTGVGDPAPSVTAICPPQAVFCESFEDDPLPADRWSLSGMAGTITIDASQSVDGQRSLHLRSGAPYGLAPPFTASLLKPIPATNDRIYMRVYMRYGDLSLPGYHPNLITVTDGNYDIGHWPDFSIWSFGWFWNDFSINAFGRGLDGAKIWMEPGNAQQPGGFYLGDETPDTEQGLHVNEWHCLELMGFGADLGQGNTVGDGEEVRAWIDGEEIAGLHADDAYWKGYGAQARWSPRYDGALWSFGIGGQPPKDGQRIDIWYDALAFGTERLGCAR